MKNKESFPMESQVFRLKVNDKWLDIEVPLPLFEKIIKKNREFIPWEGKSIQEEIIKLFRRHGASFGLPKRYFVQAWFRIFLWDFDSSKSLDPEVEKFMVFSKDSIDAVMRWILKNFAPLNLGGPERYWQDLALLNLRFLQEKSLAWSYARQVGEETRVFFERVPWAGLVLSEMGLLDQEMPRPDFEMPLYFRNSCLEFPVDMVCMGSC